MENAFVELEGRSEVNDVIKTHFSLLYVLFFGVLFFTI